MSFKGGFHFIQAIKALEYSSWKENVLIVVIVEFHALTEFGVLKPHSFKQLTQTPRTQGAVSMETDFQHRLLYINSRTVMVTTFLCFFVIISFASLTVCYYYAFAQVTLSDIVRVTSHVEILTEVSCEFEVMVTCSLILNLLQSCHSQSMQCHES